MSKPNSPHSAVKTKKMLFGNHSGSWGVKTSASGNIGKDKGISRKPEGPGSFLRCSWLSLQPNFLGSEFFFWKPVCRWVNPFRYKVPMNKVLMRCALSPLLTYEVSCFQASPVWPEEGLVFMKWIWPVANVDVNWGQPGKDTLTLSFSSSWWNSQSCLSVASSLMPMKLTGP